MSHDCSSIETLINRTNEEIWIDGPLSTSTLTKEIWIDGPREFASYSPKYRRKKTKPMHTKAKLSLNQHELDRSFTSATFDTESIVSSHCHLPVLPVFKDHSLLPFRAHQSQPMAASQTLPITRQLSVNRLNDDLELLEKTLETLLIPSPIVPNRTDNETSMTKSIHRIEQLSSLMSNDEKSKRLSRIVSPTRFEKLLM
jgi:hypothetical protein